MQPRAQQRRRTERPAINGAACVPRPSGAVRRERFEGPLLARLERDAAAPRFPLIWWRRPRADPSTALPRRARLRGAETPASPTRDGSPAVSMPPAAESPPA